MIYGYDTDITKVIKRYEISNGYIIVTYLDGIEQKYEYTRAKEIEIQNTMMKQAKERDESGLLEQTTIDDKKIKNASLTFAAVAAMGFISGYMLNNEGLTIAGGVSLMSSAIIGSKILDLHKKIQELKKYSLYLKNVDKIQELSPSVYEGVEHTVGLNINTIDGFSLDDLNKIDENIKNHHEDNVKKFS